MSLEPKTRKKLKDYPDILSVSDIQEILQVNVKTVYQILKKGQLKYFKVGKMYKVTKRNMACFLNASPPMDYVADPLDSDYMSTEDFKEDISENMSKNVVIDEFHFMLRPEALEPEKTAKLLPLHIEK